MTMKKYYLYRFYDKNEELLYVGVSLNYLMRISQHRSIAEWFDSVANVRIERCKNRLDMYQKEIRAVQKESPLHNIQHTEKFSLTKRKNIPKSGKTKPEIYYDYDGRQLQLKRVTDKCKNAIEQGKAKKITYKILKHLGLTTNKMIQKAQYNLLNDGYVVQAGRSFIASESKFNIKPKGGLRIPLDNAEVKNLTECIAEDITSGKVNRLTYALAKDYGLSADKDIQMVQYELLKSGHLKQKGREFISAVKKAA